MEGRVCAFVELPELCRDEVERLLALAPGGWRAAYRCRWVAGDADIGPPPPVATAICFIVSEALANIASYAVTVERTGDRVVAEVADDGVGGADIARGSGLHGLSDRVAALDGRFELHSLPGGGRGCERSSGWRADGVVSSIPSRRIATNRMSRIFISYRREDTSADALLIYKELEAKYGRGEIFMDVQAIRPGVDFVAEIEGLLASCDVVLVLIGRFWARNQAGAARLHEPKDLVRHEVAASLAGWREQRTHLIPVLAPGTSMPTADELPDELRGLERINAVKLTYDLWEASIDGLLRSIERLVAPPAVPRSSGLGETTARPAVTRPSGHPPPTHPPAEHFAAVAHGVFAGRVAFFLGPGVNLCERDARDWDPGVSRFPPSSRELAAHLARVLHVDEFLDLGPELDSLETVADFAETTLGEAPLYDALRSVFATEFSPTSVHRALARVARLLRDHDGRGLLVATVNYDDILEAALAEAGVQYDVVAYVAAGEHQGNFLHYPAGGHPVVVERPNEYADVTEDRPVILKLLGGIDRDDPERDSYVVSEEDQVDYASRGHIWRMMPITVPAQIRKSHLLFLGLSPRPRLFRVVLEKMFGGWQPPRGWAVHLDPDVLSRGEWTRRGVDVFDTDLVEYVEQLMKRIDRTVIAAGER